MSRWIDAEWLIKESMPLSFSVQKWVNEVQIMTAPSIDLVRCGECIRWENGRVDFSNCELMGIVKPNDFCSYGERKENE